MTRWRERLWWLHPLRLLEWAVPYWGPGKWLLGALWWVELRLSPKKLWHGRFGHPEGQRAGPWCNCMDVFNVCEEVEP